MKVTSKRFRTRIASLALLLLLSTCFAQSQDPDNASKRLPTGVRLDPVGSVIALGSMPLSMTLIPGGDKLLVSLGGWREQGVQIINLKTSQVDQTLKQEAAFLGLAFSRDGHTLYASGGNDDSIYCYDWEGNRAQLRSRIELAKKDPNQFGSRYPAGLAISNDGKFLYVAENLGDALAVLDLAKSEIVQRLPTEHYPYALAVSQDGAVYVSAWGGNSVSAFRSRPDGQLFYSGRIGVGRHPSALLLNSAGSRLFVTLASIDRVVEIDTHSRRIVRSFSDAAPGGPQEGTTPNALALSKDESRLYVAEADSNSIAVFDLTPHQLSTHISQQPAGRIPTDWYPTAVLEHQGKLLILNGKGQGTTPNPDGPVPAETVERPLGYTLGQLNGSLRVAASQFTKLELATYSRRVASANGWSLPHQSRHYPPFKHVVYIIKENRTYDQIFGDLPQGDGDRSLLFFGHETTPNHRALAERFGLFDRFFTNAEVSSQGHVWSTAAYVTDYSEKVIPLMYANKRPDIDEGEVDEPANGWLWTLATKSGVTFRDYGEWVETPGTSKGFNANRPGLRPDVSIAYPSFNMKIPDQRRADVWISELNEFARNGEMPQLEIMHLPGDHLAAARPGLCTPHACMADNDLALGRIVEALSHSPFWKDTVIFVLEDDAQAGPDHVDSHRAPLLVISAYNRPGTINRFANTTDVVAAIEDILGLERLSQYDYFSRSLADVFAATPNFTPYKAIKPVQSLDETNPAKGAGVEESMAFDLTAPDRINDAAYNLVLWRMIKGQNAPIPSARYASPVHQLRVSR